MEEPPSSGPSRSDDVDRDAHRAELVKANERLRREVHERIRLQMEERRLRELSEVRFRVSSALARAHDLDTMLDTLIGGIHELLPADLVAIALFDDDGELRLGQLDAAYGYPGVSEDVEPSTLRSHPALRAPGIPVNRRIIDPTKTLGPARSMLAVEMQTAGDAVGFVILESRYEDCYVQQHSRKLLGLLELAAAMIANLRLKDRHAELAAAAERDRLRRDLHDTVVQTLAATNYIIETELHGLGANDPSRPILERINRLADEANAEIRDLLRELRAKEQLCPDLVDTVLEVSNDPDWPFAIDITTSVRPGPADPDVTTVIRHVLQEALVNSGRHAAAERVVVELTDEPALSLHITDDGCGFDPDAVHRDRMGLSIMAERAAAIGASLEIRSEPGAGTSIHLAVDG